MTDVDKLGDFVRKEKFSDFLWFGPCDAKNKPGERVTLSISLERCISKSSI